MRTVFDKETVLADEVPWCITEVCFVICPSDGYEGY